MSNDTARPTHRVFAVIKKQGADKGVWTEIGACWPHKDAKGFAVRLSLIPIDANAEIVIREARETNAEEGAAS